MYSLFPAIKAGMYEKYNFLISDTMVCTGCCATLDHIVTYLFKQLYQKGML